MSGVALVMRDIDAQAWQIVGDLLSGVTDHTDESTREQIAAACAHLDASAANILPGFSPDTAAQWDEYLCRVETREA